MPRSIFKLTRRDLLAVTGSGLLAGAVGAGGGYMLGVRRERWKKMIPPRVQPLSPSVFLALDEQGTVTVWLTKSEMGQGVMTALPMIVAEELGCEWAAVKVERALASRAFGDQSTAASESVRSLYDDLRLAGAAAREMLLIAGAEALDVNASDCYAESGAVVHRTSGQRAPFAALVARASELDVPKNPPLKPRSAHTLLGTRIGRIDTPDKTRGRATFGLDVRQPGQLYAVVARPPVFGGKVARFSDAKAKQVPGVVDVFAIDNGVAVVGETTWAALEGRRALDVAFDDGSNRALSTASIDEELRSRRGAKAAIARIKHNPDSMLEGAERVIEAEYEFPYLAHAAMEPINCTAHVHDGRCEIWAPTQSPQEAQGEAMALLGLEEPNVTVHTTFLGGGFGRRADTIEVREAVQVAKRTGKPTQLVWTREDDIQHDFYRHGSLHSLRAALDAERSPSAYTHRIVSPSMMGLASEDGTPDALAVQGAADMPYAFPNIRIDWVSARVPVPMGIWRSVGHSFNAFAVECFVDELAHAAKRDPVDFRASLLRGAPRLLGTLRVAADKAAWQAPLPEGRARGVACHSCFGSHATQIAEISVEEGRVRVHRVVAAVDCGITINPWTIEAQIEGGIAFGLSAALYGRITFDDGRVVESNFHDYPIIRMHEMPKVEVYIAESDDPPGGVGELAVPTIAPAVANALFALTGKRVRRLPIALEQQA